MWKSFKRWLCHGDEPESAICFEWDENDNAQYEQFAVEHFEECGVPTPWLCFKYVGRTLHKKMVCPVCGAEHHFSKKS